MQLEILKHLMINVVKKQENWKFLVVCKNDLSVEPSQSVFWQLVADQTKLDIFTAMGKGESEKC